VLIVTFDEDNRPAGNRIAAIVCGAPVAYAIACS
jgi:hypothetical protein